MGLTSGVRKGVLGERRLLPRAGPDQPCHPGTDVLGVDFETDRRESNHRQEISFPDLP